MRGGRITRDNLFIISGITCQVFGAVSTCKGKS